MDNFKIIYKILSYLEKSMDYDEFDVRPISHTALGISRERWESVLVMLQKNGYIDGLLITQTLSSRRPQIVEVGGLTITLQGLEYLNENSLMKRAGNLAKGLVDIIK